MVECAFIRVNDLRSFDRASNDALPEIKTRAYRFKMVSMVLGQI